MLTDWTRIERSELRKIRDNPPHPPTSACRSYRQREEQSIVAEPNYMANITGVFGDPVAENPTGVMQNAAFQALGLNWRYLNFEVTAANLAAAVQGMRAMNNFRGVNCTIPHKVAVIQYLDEVAASAQVIGAVNTVRREGGRLIGENTDGKGFMTCAGLMDAGVDATRCTGRGRARCGRCGAGDHRGAGAGRRTAGSLSSTAATARGETLARLLNCADAGARRPSSRGQGAYRAPAGTPTC
jgi:shikimate dehydrogenase